MQTYVMDVGDMNGSRYLHLGDARVVVGPATASDASGSGMLRCVTARKREEEAKA